MKKLSCINKLLVLVIALAAIACNGIFVPDPIDPRLPKYTESGNNVAGAFVNNKVWESTVTWGLYDFFDTPEFYVWPEKDSVVIRFSGNTGDESAYIEFHLKDWNIADFEDISKLSGLKIELDGNENSAYYIEGSNYPEAYKYKGIGQFYPKNIQLNDSLTSATISGTFGFTVTDSVGVNTKVTYGRFDYRISKEDDFFVYTEW
jgi:hypothetical protein